MYFRIGIWKSNSVKENFIIMKMMIFYNVINKRYFSKHCRQIIDDVANMAKCWENVLPESTQKFRAFYSSELDIITTNPLLMRIPHDDHLVHRGHGVFDTANLYDGKVYGLNMHLDRFFKSAKYAGINHSFSKEELIEIILETTAASKKRENALIRYWLSPGRGSFAVNPNSCERAFFYCIVHDYSALKLPDNFPGIKEYTVNVPFKPPLLAVMKSNNYLLNALVAMQASAKGGDLGVWVSDDGHVLEGAIAALAFLGKDGILRTPAVDKILASTTAKRLIDLASQHLCGNSGPLNGVEMCDITIEDAKNCVEMYQLGGGSIKPIVEWDNIPIDNGKVGPVFKQLEQLLVDDLSNPEYTHSVEYND